MRQSHKVSVAGVYIEIKGQEGANHVELRSNGCKGPKGEGRGLFKEQSGANACGNSVQERVTFKLKLQG